MVLIVNRAVILNCTVLTKGTAQEWQQEMGKKYGTDKRRTQMYNGDEEMETS
jgi:hypothetical protein